MFGALAAVLGLCLDASCAPFGGSSSASGGSGAGGDAIANGAGGGVMSFSGCGVSCDAKTPCTGHNMVCVPDTDGGVCKPSTCPVCPSGKVCAFDSIACEPLGCTSDACGFTLVGACDDCVRASCCALDAACAEDPDCVALNSCASACFSADCVTGCEQGTPASSLQAFNAASACNHASCQAACFGSSASSASSGSSASSSSGGGASSSSG